MLDRLNLYKPLYVLLLVSSGIIVGFTYFIEPRYFYLFGALWLIIAVYTLVRCLAISQSNEKFFGAIREAIFGAQRDSVAQFPLPTIIARENGEIVWCNDSCREQVLAGRDVFAQSLFDLLPDIDFSAPNLTEGNNISIDSRLYTAYLTRTDYRAEHVYVVYLADDNDLKMYTREYFDSRPSVLIMLIDNYSELFQDAKENERSRVMGDIEHIIETFAEENKGLVRKLDKDRYLAIIEDRYMRQIFDNRFEVLDKIRSVVTGDRIAATMSIGVGAMSGNLHEAESLARQALDMALGRGGDQAAVKLKNGYEFYGGISKGVEKRNKVRTRIVANAISEIVGTSDNVFIMGHRFADLDCLGAAIGLYAGIKNFGKPCNIVLDVGRSLAQPLYERVVNEGYDEVIISPAQAMEHLQRNSLLIVVDTHVRNILESAELYEKCRNVVVIDHHRKMVNHIDNAIIFFHEPYASSTCEMAAELVQYLGDKQKIGVAEAESMLAGIMLDTKNFTIRTGVRTFEAAAYLRRMGADTVEVRKLFASSMESYQQKTRLVSSSEVYRNCAMAYTNSTSEDIRVVAPQAADELLNISDVEASFVMYEAGGGVSISARSMGKINVQIIMEALGGGGHLTMAGAQLPDISIEDARQKLLEAIDNYFEQMGKNKRQTEEVKPV